jgi:hypothetical protein
MSLPKSFRLSYESSLDNVAEVSVRLYVRGRSYANTRIGGALLSAAGFALLAFLGFHSKENVNIIGISIAAAAWGAALFFFTYQSTVRRRIANYVAKELGGTWPRATTVEVTDGKLIAIIGGARTTYALADLSNVNESSSYLELSFGPQSLCVIPLRAFEDTDEKTTFLTTLGRP